MVKYHPPIEVKVVEPIKVEEETITYNVDPIVPTAYIEKPPFPIRIKDHAKASSMVRKSYTRTPTPPEQINIETSIAMVKDFLVDNIDGHVIYFCDEAARIAKPDIKDKHRPVVAMLVASIKIGDHCYHGLHWCTSVLNKWVLTPFRDDIWNRRQVSVCDRVSFAHDPEIVRDRPSWDPGWGRVRSGEASKPNHFRRYVHPTR